MGDVTGVDTEQKCVFVTNADRNNVPVLYDDLILATGATHSYFGHNEFEKFAPGMKSLADAVATRNKVLQAFELAEAEEDPTRRRELLTFVMVGAGPTGVELASALAVLTRTALMKDFRRIDPASARIVLIDMAPRVLTPFSERLSKAAKQHLEKLGVEVCLGHSVEQIDDDGVVVGGERIVSKTVIWTAGVAPSPAGKWLHVETDRAGRVRVQGDLTVPGHPEIFVIGDTASFEENGKSLPSVAQVAMQQGRHAAKVIHRRITGGSPPDPFSYFDKGNMAVVGKGFAVLESHKVEVSGFGAWLAWAFVHLQFLATSSLRLSVFLQWVWTYMTGQRGSRLIVNHHGPQPAKAAEASQAIQRAHETKVG
jgi:NADH dehydrogenase FAD-containing subunit